MIRINGVSKAFEDLVVFKDLSFDIPVEGVTVLLGPSGCGKTTLLNIMSGMLKADSGSVTGITDRKISYLFQEPRLLPWKTVAANIELVLKRYSPADERRALIRRTLSAVGLEEFADYFPEELSGGMRQRAAMARAFAYPGDILLMDEPFQALDLNRKISLVRAFESLWRDDKRTGIFVTHDVHEAIMLGDVLVLFSGRPARVIDIIRNPVGHEERSLKNEGVLDLEKKIYRLLVTDDGGKTVADNGNN